MSRWTVAVQCSDDYADLADITWPRAREYAFLHGANFISWKMGAWYPHGGWTRPEYILSIMDGDPETEGVFLCDTDALILRTDVAIWKRVGWSVGAMPRPYSAAFPYELWGGMTFPSAGLCVIRNNEQGRGFLRSWISLKATYLGHPWEEQAGLYHLLGYDPDVLDPCQGKDTYVSKTPVSDCTTLLAPEWHATPKNERTVPHPRIYHATGIAHADRLHRLSAMAAETVVQ